MSDALAGRFREFAHAECAGSSPLYFALALGLADDPDVLEVARHAAPGQPVPNLLFAAVHALIARDAAHPLAACYADLTPDPAAPESAFPVFRDFVCARRDDIIALLRTRLVQTNEVRRSAYLFPACLFAAHLFTPRPLALIEIGCSAGLNLLFDRYRYAYGDGETFGDPGSDVLITSMFTRARPAALGMATPVIIQRIGLDLNVIDTTVPDEAAWLRALVWPEHHERRHLMDAALRRRREVALDLRSGDGFAMFADVVGGIPAGTLPFIFHTHVANQISEAARQEFLGVIDRLGATRDVIHVGNNIWPHLHLTAYRDGQRMDMPLARTDGHARWIEWLQS